MNWSRVFSTKAVYTGLLVKWQLRIDCHTILATTVTINNFAGLKNYLSLQQKVTELNRREPVHEHLYIAEILVSEEQQGFAGVISCHLR